MMDDVNIGEMIARLKFDEHGLIPAIVQDHSSRQVLTIAYMNRETLELSLKALQTYFWSRSRQRIWHKGATSGNTQRIVRVDVDCDGDALLVWVDPQGPACHTGEISCFFTPVFSGGKEITHSETRRDLRFSETLENLVRVIKSRKSEMPEGSYTSYLFSKGIDKILKKIGEESAETIVAAKNKSKAELIVESTDLLYHLLVLLVNEGVEMDEVLAELDRRAQKNASDGKHWDLSRK
jgi:phosphoribosyl-ATP pyrophosphohydrolase/phosphoribosyl-AMP cyclohydrolase